LHLSISGMALDVHMEMPIRRLSLVVLLVLAPGVRVGAQTSGDHPAAAPPTLDGHLVRDVTFAAGAQTPEPKPPTPRHTGFAALFFDTVDDFKMFPRRPSTWVILGIGAGGAGLVHPFDDNANQHFVGSRNVGRFFAPGKYLGQAGVQAGVAVGVYLAGRYIFPPAKDAPQNNKMSHLGFDLLRAVIESQVFVQTLKVVARRDRPTGECCAFPSGHAATSFATASVIERHLGYRGAIPTYIIATYVGASRLHDNRHFLSDVVFGSALGVATGWTIVGRHGRTEYALTPVPTSQGVMLALVRQNTIVQSRTR
jgi:membrane-associated phospholipid phosphatase